LNIILSIKYKNASFLKRDEAGYSRYHTCCKYNHLPLAVVNDGVTVLFARKQTTFASDCNSFRKCLPASTTRQLSSIGICKTTSVILSDNSILYKCNHTLKQKANIFSGGPPFVLMHFFSASGSKA